MKASTKIGVGVANLADDDRDRRALALTGEVGRALPLGETDAFEPVEEVEVPPIAAELAIGDRPQADALLVADELGDALVFDRGQRLLRGVTVSPRLAGGGEALGAEQAADVVGVKRELRHAMDP